MIRLHVSSICSLYVLVAGFSFGESFSTVMPTVADSPPTSSSPSASFSPKTNPENTLCDEQIIQLAQSYLQTGNGFYAPIVTDIFAEDFVFRGGVIGPLNKIDYCTTMEKMGIARSFDLQPNAFGFCVDPDLPNAARFFVRYTGKQVEPVVIAGTPVNTKAVSVEPIQGPTENFLLQFNDDGKVKFQQIGAPQLIGNPKEVTTGQYGAVLGIFHHIGLGVAAEAAMNKNIRQASNAAASLLPADKAPPLTRSKMDAVPKWYKE